MKKVIRSDQVQVPAGPYSQGVISGDFVFASGQFGTLPDGRLAGESIEEQTRQAIANLAAIAQAGGSDLTRAVKITVILADDTPAIVKRMNEEYAKHLDPDFPGRTGFTARLFKPGALIEIDGIFSIGD